MSVDVANNATLPNGSADPEKAAADLATRVGQVKIEDDTTQAVDIPVHDVKGANEIAVAANGIQAEEQPETPSSALKLNLPRTAADGLIKTPLAEPLETSKPAVRPALTAEQETKYAALYKNVSAWTEIPETSAKGSKSTAMTDSERMFLTRECLLRYLRATSWNVAQAETRLRNTLVWRREYGLEKHTKDYISIENATGKQLILGWDNEGRTCQYMRPSKQNTERSDRQIQHLVFMLERSIDMMPCGQETLALLINFAETKSGQGATLSQGKQTLNILQNHYPERLGRALVTNVPFYIWGFFKLITPFIDPLTREKIKFNEDSGIHVPREQLLKESGGLVEFEYDHEIYWPALNDLCELKRQQYRARWEKGGKRIGEYEGYLKGGDEKSLAEREVEAGQSSA
ncbi:Phosphatidylinositol transfer protein PDR16 [Cladophialophora carrionii]|uniref:Phosphatidylinositol transfer protein PDR16 n=1 Tax=Cladophialophora carrionii TaxID=86049 RepID=A0A1C1C9H8_9EURO|nr:Phosphatidylinositol transfer protein PDR16 [Cladophialophora carrionii]